MKKREQLRIYQLWEASEDSKGQVNVATQTDLTFQSTNDNAMPYRNVQYTSISVVSVSLPFAWTFCFCSGYTNIFLNIKQ